MFKVSRRVDYGLRLLIALASEPDAGPQATALLAEKLDIPLAFLHQIGRSLIQAGYLKASPGPGGGLRLNRPAESITLRNVLEVLEGPICLTGSGENDAEDCPEVPCSTTQVWEEIQNHLVKHLDRIDLNGLAAAGEKNYSGILAMRDLAKQASSLAA
jgi:Rrf2 family protein